MGHSEDTVEAVDRNLEGESEGRKMGRGFPQLTHHFPVAITISCPSRGGVAFRQG
jgi:hypothetical protein